MLFVVWSDFDTNNKFWELMSLIGKPHESFSVPWIDYNRAIIEILWFKQVIQIFNITMQLYPKDDRRERASKSASWSIWCENACKLHFLGRLSAFFPYHQPARIPRLSAECLHLCGLNLQHESPSSSSFAVHCARPNAFDNSV